MPDKIVTLYRPVGLAEMQLILEVDPQAFPPREPEETFFYLVLDDAYAHKVARDCKTREKSSGYAGFVTKFAVDADYIEQFEKRVVDETQHQQLCVPSDQVVDFNIQIQGNIDVVAAYYGDDYEGARHEFRDFAADGMCKFLYELVLKNKHDFRAELMLNRRAIYVNYPYWLTQTYDEIPPDRFKMFLQYLTDAWQERFPDWYLPHSEKVNDL